MFSSMQQEQASSGRAETTCQVCGKVVVDFLYQVYCAGKHCFCQKCLNHHCMAALATEVHSLYPTCCGTEITKVLRLRQGEPAGTQWPADFLFPSALKYWWSRAILLQEEAALELERNTIAFCQYRECNRRITWDYERLTCGEMDSTMAYVAVCSGHETKTCVLCEGAAHPVNECPERDGQKRRQLDDRQVASELAKSHGLKACPLCGILVERISGCPIMGESLVFRTLSAGVLTD